MGEHAIKTPRRKKSVCSRSAGVSPAAGIAGETPALRLRNSPSDSDAASKDSMRLDCPAPQLACPTVLSTMTDKPAKASSQTIEVLEAAGESSTSERREVLSSVSGPHGFAPSRLCVSVLLLLALATCGATRADGPKRGDDPIQAVFDRVKKMSPAEQQSWLEQLEQRAARAARLTMSPKEAVEQQERTQALLHQETVTWQVLREVLEDTEAREKAAESAKKQAAEVVKKESRQNRSAGSRSAGVSSAAGNAGETPAIQRRNPPSVSDADAKMKPTKKEVAKQPPASDAVTVNVDELDARIAGCNLALRELEAALTEKTTVWDASKLEPLSDRLKELVTRHHDLALVRNAVPKEQRATVTELESPKMAISLFATRVAEARKRANDSKIINDDIERQAELTRLDALAHRLAELAGK
jgi:hypothetical protein